MCSDLLPICDMLEIKLYLPDRILEKTFLRNKTSPSGKKSQNIVIWSGMGWGRIPQQSLLITSFIKFMVNRSSQKHRASDQLFVTQPLNMSRQLRLPKIWGNLLTWKVAEELKLPDWKGLPSTQFKEWKQTVLRILPWNFRTPDTKTKYSKLLKRKGIYKGVRIRMASDFSTITPSHELRG